MIHLIEATNGLNHGKFALVRFDREHWERLSLIEAGEGVTRSLLSGRGWTPEHVLVVDLQIGEGAIFYPGGLARADLNKRRIWVCPLFESFLAWVYTQDLSDLGALPLVVELPDAPPAQYGYRRLGPPEAVLADLLAAAERVLAEAAAQDPTPAVAALAHVVAAARSQSEVGDE